VILLIVSMVLVLLATVLGAGGLISPWWSVGAALLMIYAAIRRSERRWMPARGCRHCREFPGRPHADSCPLRHAGPGPEPFVSRADL
jgi:hypothetical protein